MIKQIQNCMGPTCFLEPASLAGSAADAREEASLPLWSELNDNPDLQLNESRVIRWRLKTPMDMSAAPKLDLCLASRFCLRFAFRSSSSSSTASILVLEASRVCLLERLRRFPPSRFEASRASRAAPPPKRTTVTRFCKHPQKVSKPACRGLEADRNCSN